MGENKFALAGWLAITQAVLFPVAFGMGIFQSIIGARFFDYTGPMIGPSDLLMIIITAIGIYTFLMFKKYLNEKYDFHGIDILIIVSIIWSVLFEFAGIGVKLLVMSAWRLTELEIIVIFITFLSISMITIGIIDILIAVRLLKKSENFSSMIRALAYLMLIGGILEVSVFLSIFSLILVPVTLVILGLIFLKENQTVEFV
jgi:hypothetical protein